MWGRLTKGTKCFFKLNKKILLPIRLENVPWQSNNLPSSLSFQNAIILCGTNNNQWDSSEDIVDGILEIALTLRKKYNHLNTAVFGLLPHDENLLVN